ncbi:MAG: Haloacid dehalogenase-like hydrolase [uncultured Rubrobacteraceae bacterium]|uniref:Haloacid dehalogenase-like hydrolase n=1 Tax=uncultured Rubrobacteraceae bacterium TaxID=349277 RepID=A0A6N3ITW6_9ACTN|nr:MAG: Haloacid dehalogenase-like hydrolase [uncultured Rubrobacteraceae bacterium]
MVAEHNGGLRFDLGAFDLDGTLLRRDLGITDRTLAAMKNLRERGMRLVVATGRRYESAVEHAGRLGFGGGDPVVCYGGSMIRRMDGETLLHRTLPRDLGLEVLRWAAERGLHARVLVDGRVITSPDSPAALRFSRRNEEPGVVVVDSPAEWLAGAAEEPTKVVIVDHPDDVEGWLGEAQETFRGRLFVTRSLPHYVEVGVLEGTKSNALEFLCGRWGIDPRRTVAFGDADNDADMLRFAGCGVAVGPMTDEVRRAADEVVPNVDEDGVALYVEKLLGDY